MQYPKSDYREYPKSLDPSDLWGQVRRTVNGKPVSEEQIGLIVRSVRSGLQLNSSDVVLDLACGNGALSSHLFDFCHSLHGVDWSRYLIEIANSRFLIPGKSTFLADDAAHYVQTEQNPARFSKALCYGSFSFFSEADVIQVIRNLSLRFTNVSRVFLGNLPEFGARPSIYSTDMNYVDELKDNTAQIGIWRSAVEMHALASAERWDIEFINMPTEFYAAHYRFDAILTRNDISS